VWLLVTVVLVVTNINAPRVHLAYADTLLVAFVALCRPCSAVGNRSEVAFFDLNCLASIDEVVHVGFLQAIGRLNCLRQRYIFLIVMRT